MIILERIRYVGKLSSEGHDDAQGFLTPVLKVSLYFAFHQLNMDIFVFGWVMYSVLLVSLFIVRFAARYKN